MIEVSIFSKKYGLNKTILENIEFSVDSGKTCLVIAPSGCGKTTLIRCITNETRFIGDVYMDSDGAIGYVPQTINLDEEETPYEAIFFSAQQSNPTIKRVDLDTRTSEVLKQLGIAHVSGQKIKTLSGGQKKRVQSACQLVRNTDILLLDEADTGLDAGTAYSLFDLLIQKTKQENKNVIAISHNVCSEFLHLFDYILVLARNKNNASGVAFYGRTSKVFDYFKPANSLLQVMLLLQSKAEGGNGKGAFYVERYRKLPLSKKEFYMT